MLGWKCVRDLVECSADDFLGPSADDDVEFPEMYTGDTPETRSYLDVAKAVEAQDTFVVAASSHLLCGWEHLADALDRLDAGLFA